MRGDAAILCLRGLTVVLPSGGGRGWLSLLAAEAGRDRDRHNPGAGSTLRRHARCPGGPGGAGAGAAATGRGGQAAAVAIMRASAGLVRLLAAGWGRPPCRCLGAMARYGTERRGRPDSPDYRLYFSK